MVDILFIAQNSHQYNYFKKLQKNLNFKIEVTRTTHLCYKSYTNTIDILNYKQKEIIGKYKPFKASVYYKYIKFITPYFECNYRYFIKKYNPKIVAFWNGIKYPQNIGVKIAKSMNKECLYFENGFLPDTTQVDTKGVNALNSLPREKSFYETLQYQDIKLPSKLIPRKIEGKQKLEDITLPENYIFVPFQVAYDSQIIYFSDFKSMRELFFLIKDISKKLDLTFVFKEHPSDKVNDYSDLYKEANSKLIFANSIDTATLIKNANAVITINSSVGTEALLFNKKVFVLGEAFYAIDGITCKVTKNNLLDKLKNKDYTVDKKLIKNFLSYLVKDYFIPNSWQNPKREHFLKLEEKIKDLLK